MLAAVTACQTPSGRTTWLDDVVDGIIDDRPLDRSPSPWPTSPPLEAEIEPEPLAAPRPADLETALLRFTVLHRERGPREPSDRWPPWLVSEWRALLADIKLGLPSPAVAADRRLLRQIRVTLEAEMERMSARFGPAPPDLRDDTQVIFVGVQRHLARPPPRLEAPPPRDFDLVWPVTPQILTSPFGYRRDPILGRSAYRFHAGIDLGGRPGTSVVAAAHGEVVAAGWRRGLGQRVKLRHAGGWLTVYAHLQRVLVRVGQTVSQGEPIGLLGSTGRSTGPHLHFEVRRENVPIDPLDLLAPRHLESVENRRLRSTEGAYGSQVVAGSPSLGP